MGYEVRCHCGAIRLAVEGDLPEKAVTCNCSHCEMKGLILAAVSGASVKITSGGDRLKTYRFNKHLIDHLFCSECGAQCFSQASGADGSPMAMINMRCVPGADLEAIEKMPFDGASL